MEEGELCRRRVNHSAEHHAQFCLHHQGGLFYICSHIAHFQVQPWETASYYQGHEKEVILSYSKNPSKQMEKGRAVDRFVI